MEGEGLRRENMKNSRKGASKGLTRREMLKLSALTLGGLTVGGAVAGPFVRKAGADCSPYVGNCYPTDTASQQYSYLSKLATINPWDSKDPNLPLKEDEMRITFLGSMVPPARRAQQEMSVFVEVGWDSTKQKPLDQFVFDCGSGVCANYGAMNIGYGRMDKIFLAHLHGDHMSDLVHIYCFGPSGDRKSPLYVWGPGRSGVRSPKFPYTYYDDGTRGFCKTLRQACRWHTESFSFQTTSYASYERPTKKSWGLPHEPIPVGSEDAPDDAYALVPIELDWKKYGKVPGDNVAYNNPKTGVKITHFPVIHCRKGSIGYKLEWNGMSMIYTSDTKPETHSIEQATNGGNGVDVFIHEMALPPEVWTMRNMGLDAPLPYGNPETQWWDDAVAQLKMVEDSSHTPQGAFGYLLSRISPRPRLTVATHFPTSDDTVECALKSVRAHCPDIIWDIDNPNNSNLIWSFDLMMLRVRKSEITQCQGLVPNFGYSPIVSGLPTDMNPPKYYTTNSKGEIIGDPYAQIDPSTEIPATNEDGTVNYCDDGY